MAGLGEGDENEGRNRCLSVEPGRLGPARQGGSWGGLAAGTEAPANH